MDADDLFPECPTHGGRIVTREQFDAELRRRDPDGRATLPDDAHILLTLRRHPRADVVDGRVRCGECGEVAEYIHLIPNAVEVSCIQAGCAEHDFEGYAIPLTTDDGLANEPFRWLHHLSSKVQSEVTLLTLVTWLDFDGAVALDRLRAA